MSTPDRHIPVLADEVLAFVPKAGLVVDGTVGDGGHAGLILRADPTKQLIGIDRDPVSIERAQSNLKDVKKRFTARCGSYADLLKLLDPAELEQVSFVLLDLGYSSAQIDNPDRGMSFMADAVLDMRYNQDDMHQTTAGEIINRASPGEIERILRDYGEERQAKKLARIIGEKRREHKITTTGELAKLVASVVYSKPGSIHPATRTFQALRIAVNHELEELAYFMLHVVPQLPKGCVVAVISFHSLEDRIVKRGFLALTKPEKDQFGDRPEPTAEALTKKVIMATDDEKSRNPRARSAKLRAVRLL